MNAIIIREAAQDDAEAIRTLLAACRLGSKDVLAPGTRYWVAEDSAGELTGTIGLELGAGAGLLRSAGVRADMRGHGIGARLLAALLGSAQDAGIRTIYLFSTDAGSYWTMRGFEEVPVPDVVAALPDAPQVRHYDELGWLPTEVAYRRTLRPLTR